ncbi:MAG: hypothetical protein E7677_05430 [Ruminococcaceae bacterium]|nr:hypothetical protein [Oscillospiraceae bacterium]
MNSIATCLLCPEKSDKNHSKVSFWLKSACDELVPNFILFLIATNAFKKEKFLKVETMKKVMKKLLCVVLVLMMTLPLMAFPAGAEASVQADLLNRFTSKFQRRQRHPQWQYRMSRS